MDEIDLKILAILQRDNRTPSEEIAAAVCLSPSAVQRRTKRLRLEGVIMQDTSLVCPEAVGRRLMVIVDVTLLKGPAYGLDSFKQSARDTPEIIQCYQVTGKADLIMIISCKDLEDYDAFTRRFFIGNPNVARFESSIVMQRVKEGMTLPLDP